MPAPERKDPIRPTDAAARSLGKELLRGTRSGALATLGRDGHPAASLVSLATDSDGTPLILVSALSAHTGNLEAEPRCSLLLSPGGKGDPLAHPRMTLKLRASKVDRETPDGARIRRRFLSRQPKAELYADFGDFSFFSLTVEGASLNGGFGRAYELAPSDLLSDAVAAQAIAEMEDGAVAHMNADHTDAIKAYATGLLGADDGGWRLTGLDPEGADLARGDKVIRLAFPEPVVDAAGIRTMLAALAASARDR
ncbi:MAG: pyridoxamine 5'-phosphate oxidase [Hyphomicrobiales bacterium]|nr:MAG: pyridoxamine 5'-phosphate oxidase [Hyphomicrobiales bacterium]